MEIDFTYGNRILTLDFPSNVSVDIFQAESNSKPYTFADFKNEITHTQLNQLCKNSKYLCIVNDGYRNTPTPTILSWLSEIDPGFLNNADFMIATGTHDAPTEKHYHKIFGDLYNKIQSRVTYHNAHDYSFLIKIGTDKFGEEVWINKAVVEYSSILIIGSVEPHYFAGFTGGRKSLFPGLNDVPTIERNHNLAISLAAAPLKIDGNPVAEHLESLLDLVKMENIISIQAVMDSKNNLIECFCGPLRSSFEKAVTIANKIYARKIDKQYDMVLAEILPPLDSNLYQAQKALEHCQRGVKDGGNLVVISACKEGIGSNFFYDLANNWDRESNKPKDGKFRFGSHKLSRVNLMSKRINIYLYSEMSPKEVCRVFYEPLDNLQKFIYSMGMDCEKINIGVVRDAGHLVLST